MTCEFLSAFFYIRHMAIGTGNATVGMDPRLEQFIIRMLGLKDRGFAQLLCKIRKIDLIIEFQRRIGTGTIFPWEGQVSNTFGILPVLVEEIFNMALGTDEGAHFLVRGFGDILSHGFKCFNQGRSADTKVHRCRIMAIGTTDIVHHLVTHGSPFTFVKTGYTFFHHQPGDIGAFTGPAGIRLGTVIRSFRGACTKGIPDIRDGIKVPAALPVVF